jgi:DNA polymerase-1
VDTEYSAPSGCRPVPACVVGKELRSGRELRLSQDALSAAKVPPFRLDERALFVSYAAPAEFSVFHALGWPAPARILDLFVEFRAMANGLKTPSGAGLLGALVYHGLPVMDGTEKTAMRDLAIRGGPFTAEERQA